MATQAQEAEILASKARDAGVGLRNMVVNGASGAYNAVKDFASGAIRGAPAQPAQPAPAGGAAPAPAPAAVAPEPAYNPSTGRIQAPNLAMESPAQLEARLRGAPVQTAATPNVGANPNIPSGGMSAEARAFQASQAQPAAAQASPSGNFRYAANGGIGGQGVAPAGADPLATSRAAAQAEAAAAGGGKVPPSGPAATSTPAAGGGAGGGAASGGASKPGLLARGAKAVGSGAGKLGIAGGLGYTAYQVANTPTADYEQRFGIGDGREYGDGVGRTLRDMGVRMAGAASDVINPFGLLDGMYSDKKNRGTAAAPAAPAAPVSTPTPAPAVQDGVRTTKGTIVSPEDMIRGTAVPAQGEGAFQVTKNGVKQPAQGIRNAPVQAGGSRSAGQPGVFGNMANLMAMGAVGRMAKEEAELGIKNHAKDLEVAKFGAEQRAKNEASIDKQLEDHARGLVPPPDGVKRTKDVYEAEVAQMAADLKDRVRHSTANRKGADALTVGQMDPATLRQQLLLNKIRMKHEEAIKDGTWKGNRAWLRDYFGANRFESKDLHNYAPEIEGPTNIPFGGGHVVKFRGGNRLDAKQLMGGDFNFTGPNGAVDSDLMELTKEMIKAHNKKASGTK